MIARDEEEFIGGCLASIMPIVDEIVLVDTGSKDRTKEIAGDYPVRLFDFPWMGDFSAARNYALDHSTSDWNLYIDADERVDSIEKSAVNTALSNERSITVTTRFHPRTGYTAYPENRLFRNDPRIRFKGVIHETIMPDIHAIMKSDDMQATASDIRIRHLGYDVPKKSKTNRNLPLLIEETQKDPERVYLWWHLGATQMEAGNVKEAETAWRRAIDISRSNEVKQHVDSLAYVELINLERERGDDSEDLLLECLDLFPENYNLHWLLSQHLTSKKRYQEAIPTLQMLVGIDGDEFIAPISYQEEIFGLASHEALGNCYFKLEDYESSAVHYGVAEQLSGGSMQHKVKRQMAEARAKP
jgi:glycosyltransferase involved in cell wall biosynthesis